MGAIHCLHCQKRLLQEFPGGKLNLLIFLFCHQLLFFFWSAALVLHAMLRGPAVCWETHDRLNISNGTLRHLAVMYVNKMDKRPKCEEEE